MILIGSLLAAGRGRVPAGEDLSTLAVGGQEFVESQLGPGHIECGDES
jgi:hypothetical protein